MVTCSCEPKIASLGVFPIIPVLIGAGVVGAGYLGYEIGKPETDQYGRPIPGVAEKAASAVGEGIGSAIKWAAVMGIAYLIYTRETKGRR